MKPEVRRALRPSTWKFTVLFLLSLAAVALVAYRDGVRSATAQHLELVENKDLKLNEALDQVARWGNKLSEVERRTATAVSERDQVWMEYLSVHNLRLKKACKFFEVAALRSETLMIEGETRYEWPNQIPGELRMSPICDERVLRNPTARFGPCPRGCGPTPGSPAAEWNRTFGVH